MYSCQFPYVAEIDDLSGLITIDGSLVKGDTIQTINVSRSTSLTQPGFDPVTGCVVVIEDELGNIFTFPETKNGKYQLEIEDESIVIGRKYKLIVISLDDKRYESDYEKISPGAPVDSVYFEKDKFFDPSQDIEMEGLQFYLDLKGSESESRYYRWILTETWEYKSISPAQYYYNSEGDTVNLESPYEFYRCWINKKIPGLYSSSTVNLTTNLKKKIPLHFVSNKTNRLGVRYSLMVEQYSMSEGAYSYWNQIKIETEESGGLYTQQPGQTKSNLFNVNDATERVLGYFWASSKKSKRIFVNRPSDLAVYISDCELLPLDTIALNYGPFPVYVFMSLNVEYTSSQPCMNCTLAGGENIKPTFWE
jgi:hypothetical protein